MSHKREKPLQGKVVIRRKKMNNINFQIRIQKWLLGKAIWYTWHFKNRRKKSCGNNDAKNIQKFCKKFCYF